MLMFAAGKKLKAVLSFLVKIHLLRQRFGDKVLASRGIRVTSVDYFVLPCVVKGRVL